MQGHEHDEPRAPGALDAQAAIDIFMRKKTRVSRDATTAELAARYNITMKAVRDVWNMRTWTKTTMPYWDKSDLKTFLDKHLCSACRVRRVSSFDAACPSCARPRPRGRRPPARESQAPALQGQPSGPLGPLQHQIPPLPHQVERHVERAAAAQQSFSTTQHTTRGVPLNLDSALSGSAIERHPLQDDFARATSISQDFTRVTSAEDRMFARLLSVERQGLALNVSCQWAENTGSLAGGPAGGTAGSYMMPASGMTNGFAPPTPFAEAPAFTPAFTTNEAFFAWEDPFDLSLE